VLVNIVTRLWAGKSMDLLPAGHEIVLFSLWSRPALRPTYLGLFPPR